MEQPKKEKGSIWFAIIFIVGIAFLIYFQVYKKDTIYYLERNYELEIEDSYNGKIAKKFVDRTNHNSPMVNFKGGITRGIHPLFWGQMHVGDSISKVKGDSVIQVFRNGEKIILEIAPFYEEAIENEKNKK